MGVPKLVLLVMGDRDAATQYLGGFFSARQGVAFLLVCGSDGRSTARECAEDAVGRRPLASALWCHADRHGDIVVACCEPFAVVVVQAQ